MFNWENIYIKFISGMNCTPPQLSNVNIIQFIIQEDRQSREQRKICHSACKSSAKIVSDEKLDRRKWSVEVSEYEAQEYLELSPYSSVLREKLAEVCYILGIFCSLNYYAILTW